MQTVPHYLLTSLLYAQCLFKIAVTILSSDLGSAEFIPVSVLVTEFAELHTLNVAIAPPDKFHRDALTEKGPAQFIPIPTLQHGLIQSIAYLVTYALAATKILNGSPAKFRV